MTKVEELVEKLNKFLDELPEEVECFSTHYVSENINNYKVLTRNGAGTAAFNKVLQGRMWHKYTQQIIVKTKLLTGDKKPCCVCQKVLSKDNFRAEKNTCSKCLCAYEKTRRSKYPISFMISAAKGRAKARGLDFNITERDIVIPNRCPILGIPLKDVEEAGSRNERYSLDRIDTTKGYIKGNIQVISNKANTLKSDLTPEQLISFSSWINQNILEDIAA